jgi:hypothetical protein
MQTPEEHDPYRAPRSETTLPPEPVAGNQQPLPWEPLDSFQFAFRQLRAYPMAILFAFVSTLISSIAGMVGGIAQAGLGASGDRELEALGWLIYGLSVLVNIPVATWMAVGLSRCSLAMLRGRRPELSELFGVRGAVGAIGAQILFSLVLILIGCLCLGPGMVVLFSDLDSPLGLGLMLAGLLPFGIVALVASVRLVFLNVVAADRGTGVFETLGASWNLSSGVFWLLVLFFLLAMATQILAMIGGLLLLCIGVIVTVPAGMMLIQIATADAYMKRKGEAPVGIA